jgi:hypothetical protein
MAKFTAKRRTRSYPVPEGYVRRQGGAIQKVRTTMASHDFMGIHESTLTRTDSDSNSDNNNSNEDEPIAALLNNRKRKTNSVIVNKW